MNPAPKNIDQLRIRLHEYIEQADERRLNAICMLLVAGVDAETAYDRATLDELAKRRDAHVHAINRPYSVEESLPLVRGDRK